MAKVTLDQSLCVGCGMCAQNSEEYFEFGDNGLSQVIKEDVEPEDLENVKASAELCPTEAIKVNEGEEA